jgi:uncharacterized membrane protein YfcA
MNGLLLTGLIFIAALLYSSVGHGGASGYLAAMAFFGLEPKTMKVTALILNLVVAGLGTFQFARAKCFNFAVFWPFAIFSIPCAFFGGTYQLQDRTYKIILGVVLLFAAWRLAFQRVTPTLVAGRPIRLGWALVIGAPIGLLSGLVGVGGGIFLSPLLLLLGWADVRTTAGVSAAFILVNSFAGLLGQMQHQGLRTFGLVPRGIFWWAAAALLGGLIGSELGTRRLTPLVMRRLLAAVLIVAGAKMLLT